MPAALATTTTPAPSAPPQIAPPASERLRRDPALDVLRVIGILGIVIAHTNPPPWLFQARNFGVPTMAMLAGAVHGLSQRRRPEPLHRYLGRRVVQLIVPVWTFLAVAFPLLFALGLVTGRGAPFDLEAVTGAFATTKGTPFNLWVVRSFLLCSLTAPVWWAAARWLPRAGARLAILPVVWAGYELVAMTWLAGDRSDALTRILVEEVLFFGGAFGICFGFGMYLWDLSRRQLVGTAVALAVALGAFFVVHGDVVATQAWKYPPQLPYLAYAGAVGITLLLVLRAGAGGVTPALATNPVVRLVAASSLWVFLWHGFWQEVWDLLVGGRNFGVELPLNVVLSVAAVALQQRLARVLLARLVSPSARWLVRTASGVR